MGKSIISLLLLLTAWMAPGTSVADELALAENAPDRYVVVKGDTLWDISARFLRDPWRWPDIWGLNKDQIKNPHWIYPGDVILLDFTGMTPRLRLQGIDGATDWRLVVTQHSLGGHRAFPDQTACGRQGRNGWRADPGCRAGKPGHTLRRRYRLRQRRGL
jgi:hypothetical protein